MQQKERSALHLAARTAAVGRGVCVMVSLSGCSRDSPSGAEPPLIEAEGVEIPEEKERGEGREDRYSGEVKMLWLSGDQAPGIDDQPHGGSGGRGVHEQSEPIAPAAKRAEDRKRVVKGKSGSVRVGPGGTRVIKK